MKEYVTTARINAPPETVWRILTDSAGYAAWNPEILGVTGAMAAGARIKARVKVKSEANAAIRSVGMRVTVFEPPRRMEWVGGLPFGLFVGRRIFTVTPLATGCEFRMDLHMSGPLSGPIVKSVGDRQPDIDRFATALKERAERD